MPDLRRGRIRQGPLGLARVPAMNESMALIAGVIGLVGFIVAIGVWAARKRKQIAQAWSSFAETHNLDHTPGVRHVRGTIDGGRVFVMFQDAARDSSGQMRRRQQQQQVPVFIIRIEMTLTDAPDNMSIGKLGLLMGVTQVPVGDEDFDKRVYTQCDDVEGARRFLASPARRAALTKLTLESTGGFVGPHPGQTTHDGFPMDASMVIKRWDSGYKPKKEWFEARFNEFTALAREIDESG